MAVPTLHAGHDFAAARLHGMWSASANGEVLETLAKSTTEELLLRNLHNLSIDCSDRISFQKAIYARAAGRINQIARLLNQREAEYYLSCEALSYFTNMKMALHRRYSSTGIANKECAFNDAPGMPAFDASAISSARDCHAFVKALPLFGLLGRKQLEEIVSILEEKRDFMLAECMLDRLFCAGIYSAAKALGGAIGAEACRLTGISIDIMNLTMLLRNAQTYHFEVSLMKKLWIDSGLLLPVSKLNKLSMQNKVSDILPMLPGKYRKVLENTGGQELYQWENALRKYHFHEALSSFRKADEPELAIAAFPFMLLVERINLERVFEGIHFGITSQNILDMMIR